MAIELKYAEANEKTIGCVSIDLKPDILQKHNTQNKSLAIPCHNPANQWL